MSPISTALYIIGISIFNFCNTLKKTNDSDSAKHITTFCSFFGMLVATYQREYRYELYV